MLKKVKSVTFYTLFETLLLFICFISVVKGEEKFIEPCSDAGGYYTWLGGPNKNHLGHDYNAPVGTPVKAIAEGTVFKVFDISQSRCYDPNTGKEVAQTFIWIKHRLNNGRYFYALYGHIKPSEKIKNNINVKAGEKIGEIAPCYVWDDKRKVLQSAPHLHFGIWDNEIDPPLNNVGYGPVRSFTDPKKFLKENKPFISLKIKQDTEEKSIAQTDILATYIFEGLSKHLLVLKRDHTFFVAEIGKWEYRDSLYWCYDFPSPQYESEERIKWKKRDEQVRQIYLHGGETGARFANEDVRHILIRKDGEIITTDWAVPEIEMIFKKEKNAELITETPGKLWNKYVNSEGNFFEFKNDGTYIRTYVVGSWGIFGDFLITIPSTLITIPNAYAQPIYSWYSVPDEHIYKILEGGKKLQHIHTNRIFVSTESTHKFLQMNWDSPNKLVRKLKLMNKFHSAEKSISPPPGAIVFFSGWIFSGRQERAEEIGYMGISIGNELIIHGFRTPTIINGIEFDTIMKIHTIKDVENMSFVDSYIGWAYPMDVLDTLNKEFSTTLFTNIKDVSFNIVGKWILDPSKKVEGKDILTLEFKEDGTVITIVTYNGTWEIRGDKLKLSIDPQSSLETPQEIICQVKGDTLSIYGDILKKERNAQLIKFITLGKIWNKYALDDKITSRDMVLELKENGAFISSIYFYGKYKLDGKIIKVYKSKGMESPLIYELKNGKIEVKLRDAPNKYFTLVRLQ